ncbi:MAG TPA: ABC transporter ATP-binding protein [Nitrospirota bacterium]|nr:ABC transporter ATP-binding protein [Nitrospirota bacterium]
MDDKNIINVENISKCYRIGVKDTIHDTVGGAIVDFLKSPVRNYRKYRSLYRFDDAAVQEDARVSGASDVIWALRNVSFYVREGEVLGIIGRNGAGKSTLLKILSRITHPSSGRAEIHGRISSLLEVGTGFHPELTGRENIYLNGTILGMKKREIDRQFDAIVAFSEVERFLETPVKRYSSGMRVRLAFAVAAHLEPEVLVVDEVLAVGDRAFQKKCLAKMDSVAKGGRTVLFVSHNMGIISQLCQRALLLSDGVIAAIGESKEVVSQYVSSNDSQGQVDLREWSVRRRRNGAMRVLHLSTRNDHGLIRSTFAYGEPITFGITVSGKPGTTCILGVSIRDAWGNLILHFSNTDDSRELILTAPESDVLMHMPKNILNDGTYYVTVWLGDGLNLEHDYVSNCLSFGVESPDEGYIKCRSPVRLQAVWDMRPGDT